MTPSDSYRPDDAQITVASLEFLRTLDGVRLRQRIAALPEGELTVAHVAALRKEFPAGPTHTALALAKLQPKGAGPKGKFPDRAYVWATPEALEQATHLAVSRHKAQRLAQLGARRVFDLCAGIGGDALAFAEQMPVTAVELSPVRAACLRFNVLESVPPLAHPVEVRQEDVEQVIETLPADVWVHIDPARRSAGKRSVQYADLLPGPPVLERLYARVRGVPGGGSGCVIKLSSAVDFASLPPGHLELVSHQGSVVQALLWMGTGLPESERTASVLGRQGEPWSLTAPPREVAVAEAPLGTPIEPHTLYELDGAVTRAGLAQVVADALGLMPLTMDGGYLLSEGKTLPLENPGWKGNLACALTPFEILSIIPFSKVLEALAALPPTDPGPVEVKARGNLPGIDTDTLQQQWSRAHGRACTVLLFRQANQTLAAVGFRAGAGSVTTEP